MGDPRRFELFAALIARHFPDTAAPVADVASGKGQLQAALRQLGYRDVTSWDRRPRNAKNRRGYRYGRFDHRSAPRTYALAVAMHPDEATDEVIAWAVKHRRPFAVCPCCLRPSAAPFAGPHTYADWLRHLAALARAGGLSVTAETLPLAGRGVVLVGRPAGASAAPP